MKACRKILRPVVLLCAVTSCSHDVETPIAFKGSSSDLKETVVLATLDEPIPNGKNAVWCASFQAAWKALQENVVKEPIQLKETPPVAKSLNEAPDPRPNIPSESLYVVAGRVEDGICDRIGNELRQKFPNKAPPVFSDVAPNSIVAYAYLEANVHFPLPYTQNPRPLVFTDWAGRAKEIRSFGILHEDNASYEKLRVQARVLFRKGDAGTSTLEFAVDLCSNSQPSQIVLARIPRGPTLAAGLARVVQEAAQMGAVVRTNRAGEPDPLEVADGESVLVPDLYWLIAHRFPQLEHKLTNKGLEDRAIDVAWEDIFFCLSRKGAELKSEAGAYANAPVFTQFHFDRPFLIYMRKRGAELPYFAMWVDNAELLCPWRSTGKRQPSPRGD